jgi:hypothetical protein
MPWGGERRGAGRGWWREGRGAGREEVQKEEGCRDGRGAVRKVER